MGHIAVNGVISLKGFILGTGVLTVYLLSLFVNICDVLIKDYWLIVICLYSVFAVALLYSATRGNAFQVCFCL